MPRDLWLGWDAEEMMAHVVAATSFRAQAREPVQIRRLTRASVRDVYQRETTTTPAGLLWDVISDAPMTTSHAIARFFVPWLQDYEGWALFTDGDVLCRANVEALFACADPRYAVQVVQHPPLPETGIKKAGVPQRPYPRKNWSSVMLWHCGHPANRALTLGVLNTWTGRALHGFEWLTDDQIGPLPEGWNHLVGVSPPRPPETVQLAHFTLGTPDLPGHECDPFADEWYAVARAAGYQFPARSLG